jgi:hypothetical protein
MKIANRETIVSHVVEGERLREELRSKATVKVTARA